MYIIQVKELALAGKILLSMYFEQYLMSAPFELAPRQELPELNERPEGSFDQIRYS